MQESIMKENENEDDLDYELDDASINSDNKNNIFLPEMKMVKDEDIEPKASKNTQRKNNNQTLSMNDDNENSLGLNDGSLCESDKGNQSSISLPKLEKLTIGSKPPKDFVCPITGQTYERKAIQEWLRTGNTTCPIMRQPLSINMLPKTNYVLKRFITSWKQQNPELAQEFSNANTPRGSSYSPSAKDFTVISTTQRTIGSPSLKSKKNYIRQRSNIFM
ncbi:putative E3 ubiquitin-protein ligase LIN-1 [Glycine max]|nr:putative E3 ubiquitin-protein ligase LIN-1 [Glycine max]